MKIFLLRLKKWWITRIARHFWPDVPFDIATTAISDKYENYPGKIIAEFDFNGLHWLIYEKI